jgi:hypothetical protein
MRQGLLIFIALTVTGAAASAEDVPITDFAGRGNSPHRTAQVECQVPFTCPPSRFTPGRTPHYLPQGADQYLLVVPCSVPSIIACQARIKGVEIATGKKTELTCPESTTIPFSVKGSFTFRVRALRQHEPQVASCAVL